MTDYRIKLIDAQGQTICVFVKSAVARSTDVWIGEKHIPGGELPSIPGAPEGAIEAWFVEEKPQSDAPQSDWGRPAWMQMRGSAAPAYKSTLCAGRWYKGNY